MIKPYTIHILPIVAINADTFELPLSKNALINCSEKETPTTLIPHVLDLFFQDTTEPNDPNSFNQAHAKAIIDFLETLPNEVSDLYICCSQGYSRSPAIAAAVLRMSGHSDDDVWHNPYYSPNSLVYSLLCKEANLPITSQTLAKLQKENALAFKAVQSGEPCEYERWQIIT